MSNTPFLDINILSSHCWIDADSYPNSEQKRLLDKADIEPISLKQIPTLKRRRLNTLSKMAMHTSLRCLEKAHISTSESCTVFASQHGELSRTVSIIKDMVTTQEVSPKDFSLSVHNSALGLFSIFNNNQLAGTSLAAGSNTFGYALIEAYNYLQRFSVDEPSPNSQPQHVLVTCFDSEIAPPFNKTQKNQHPNYSLSLLLSLNGDNAQRVSFGFNRQHSGATPHSLPLALSFFDFLQSHSTNRRVYSQDTEWKLTKDAVQT